MSDESDGDEIDRKTWLTEAIGETAETVEQAVRAGGGEFRVWKRDGALMICTRDYHPNRVNVAIEGGKVIEAHYG